MPLLFREKQEVKAVIQLIVRVIPLLFPSPFSLSFSLFLHYSSFSLLPLIVSLSLSPSIRIGCTGSLGNSRRSRPKEKETEYTTLGSHRQKFETRFGQ